MSKNDFNGIIEKVHIDKFRRFNNVSFHLGSKLTAIAGQNGTMKTTLLGILSQPFSMRTGDDESDEKNPTSEKDSSPFANELTLDNYKFQAKFSRNFKVNPKYEHPGDHFWTIYFTNADYAINKEFSMKSYSRTPNPGDKSKKPGLRFWNAVGRSSGDGFIQCPVIYLSLKRVSPIGEENRLDISVKELPPEDINIFNKFYQEILLLEEDCSSTEFIKSSNKATLVSHSNDYGADTISAGQDNIGKILTAILSFKKLKDNYPKDYHGGLLFIDEIDTTLYPAAQEMLINKLFYFSSRYNIQIIFTTHSPTILETMYMDKFSNHGKVLFLKNNDKQTIVEENLSFDQINAKLSVKVQATPPVPPKIRVYTEDNEARIFLKTILPPNYKKLLDILDITIGANELISLVSVRKIPEFKENLIILDGDKVSSHRNILSLPGDNVGPDRLMYDFLKQLNNSDAFWSGATTTGQYDKQICFKNFPKIDHDKEDVRRKQYKDWFLEQEAYWGKSKNKPFQYWIKSNRSLVDDFLKKFITAYNTLARKHSLQLID